jgi:nitrogen fixation/metabolism regulation signal transduction histidine kinase
MNRILSILLGLGGIAALILLFLLASATGNSSRLEEQYGVLLGLNGVVALALFAWVATLAVRLLARLKRREFGARLTGRFALAFALVGVVPGVLIYLLSVQFLSRSIESWFNVRVDTALEAGLSLGRAALDSQLQELNTRARAIALTLDDPSDSNVALTLTRLREQTGVQEAMVFTSGSRIIAFSTAAAYGALLPEPPPQSVTRQLRIARSYSAAEADSVTQAGVIDTNPTANLLRLRVIVPLAQSSTLAGGFSAEARYLQLIQPVPEQIAFNANEVQNGYRDYQQLTLSRLGLRNLYGITLTLALLLSVFAAIGAAFFLSRRLVRPMLLLAEGTQAVGVGDYRPIPEPATRDEVSQLTRSFNAMTRQLEDARNMVESNRLQLERSNAYLESILSNLSSGVLVFDENFRVATINRGAQQILRVDMRGVIGLPLESVAGLRPFADAIHNAFAQHEAAQSGRSYWQQQFEIERLAEDSGGEDCAPRLLDELRAGGTAEDHPITLLARGSHLAPGQGPGGYVVVFDDITEVISANRAMAWGEVARRLAHEIKNPLTPIQLSAERLAMKLADKLGPTDAAMLQRATGTIINQVGSMLRMVDDFREYARTPPAVLHQLDLNELIAEVLTLYGWDPDEGMLRQGPRSVQLSVELGEPLPRVLGDATQLRQVIHNLLANAHDAIDDKLREQAKLAAEAADAAQSAELPTTDGSAAPVVDVENRVGVSTRLITTRLPDGTEHAAVRLTVTDTGSGFSQRILRRAFEPYVTTKARGTGLGLAIVKKIVDEHGGRIDLTNRSGGGAMVSILLTRLSEDTRVPAGDGGQRGAEAKTA